MPKGSTSCHTSATARALCEIVHLPDFEFIRGEVVEFRLHLLLDCFLQVMDSFRTMDVNRKDVFIVESDNRAAGRDFCGHDPRQLIPNGLNAATDDDSVPLTYKHVVFGVDSK